MKRITVSEIVDSELYDVYYIDLNSEEGITDEVENLNYNAANAYVYKLINKYNMNESDIIQIRNFGADGLYIDSHRIPAKEYQIKGECI